MGALRREIMEACRANPEKQLVSARRRSMSLTTLSVMGVNNDPYRLETPANIAAGLWFAEQVNKRVPYGTIHLRGLYYLIVSAGDVRMPNGTIFVNNDDCWTWYSEHAASAGRWLGYVRFERIVDERNAPPEVYVPDANPERPGCSILYGAAPSFPNVEEALPTLEPDGFVVRQPFRIIFIGEKTSLGSILRPIAKAVGGELLLPSGETSDTMVYDAAKRAAADGRPAVVLYFSDFDPAGHTMPVSVARKLQALRTLYFPTLNIRVYPVAMTKEQVEQFGLPSTPLKEGEKRGDDWREVMGREQTEIDAMIALHPEELRRIALEAVAPFYDDTLADRVADAENAWRDQVEEAVAADPGYATAKRELEEMRSMLSSAVWAFRKAQEHAVTALRAIEVPPIDVPEVELVEEPGEPLFSTDMDFVEASLRLKAHKKLDFDQ
jgi:hypothetical protein